jgi:hypothetical protein
MAYILTDPAPTRVFLGARQEIRFRENPAKYVYFQQLSRQARKRKPLAYKRFELLLSRKTLFAEQKNKRPKIALQPVQTSDLMPCSPSKNGS